MAAGNSTIMAGQIPAVRKMTFSPRQWVSCLGTCDEFFVCQQNSITGYLWAKILDPISDWVGLTQPSIECELQAYTLSNGLCIYLINLYLEFKLLFSPQ